MIPSGKSCDAQDLQSCSSASTALKHSHPLLGYHARMHAHMQDLSQPAPHLLSHQMYTNIRSLACTLTHACAHNDIHTRTCTQTHTNTLEHTHTHKYTPTHACARARIHTHMRTRTHCSVVISCPNPPFHAASKPASRKSRILIGMEPLWSSSLSLLRSWEWLKRSGRWRTLEALGARTPRMMTSGCRDMLCQRQHMLHVCQ